VAEVAAEMTAAIGGWYRSLLINNGKVAATTFRW